MSVLPLEVFRGEIRTVVLICGELANRHEWKSTCQKYREFCGMGFQDVESAHPFIPGSKRKQKKSRSGESS